MAQAARSGRRRHLRRTRLSRLRTNPAGSYRSEAFLDFLGKIATDLAATGAGTTFTAAASDVCTAAGHGYAEGAGPFLATTTTTLPGGLAVGALYWIGVIDANTFNLHAGETREKAVASTPVDITDAGTGTHTLTRAETVEGMFHQNRANRPERMEAATDIDDLN